jgi:hypothetical protein
VFNHNHPPIATVDFIRQIPRAMSDYYLTMAPAAKKQKVDSPPKSPIVFQSPGLKPDVSFNVFDVEFHVHSILLKLHSAFFRKFLDSPDKTVSPSTVNNDSASGTTPPGDSAFGLCLASVEFKYKWATKVDENDVEKWHLVEDNSKVFQNLTSKWSNKVV